MTMLYPCQEYMIMQSIQIKLPSLNGNVSYSSPLDFLSDTDNRVIFQIYASTIMLLLIYAVTYSIYCSYVPVKRDLKLALCGVNQSMYNAKRSSQRSSIIKLIKGLESNSNQRYEQLSPLKHIDI